MTEWKMHTLKNDRMENSRKFHTPENDRNTPMEYDKMQNTVVSQADIRKIDLFWIYH